eukprot:TRINITY_DN3338_c1_g1_i1.p1 TRINITY_DN3338_c1_g1~~TRINITY_DN3338_c1_g1_i1.p1  ORF type:complete len:349 (+),score=79.37 TRINITY_DN3338_c1_g1_i1:105-1151(+)
MPSYPEECVVVDRRKGSELTEVVVTTGGYVFAVDVAAVQPTRGLRAYRRRAEVGSIRPFELCMNYHPAPGRSGGPCWQKQCSDIHLVDSAVKMKCMARLRTPCCQQHGDTACVCTSADISVRGPGKVWRFRSGNLAMTTHPCSRASTDDNVRLTLNEICAHHLNMKCKFGRECEHVHVCRVWAKKVGLTEAVVEMGAKRAAVACEDSVSRSPDSVNAHMLVRMGASTDNLSSRSGEFSTSKASAGDNDDGDGDDGSLDDLPCLLPGMDTEEDASPRHAVAMNVARDLLTADDAAAPTGPGAVPVATLADVYWLHTPSPGTYFIPAPLYGHNVIGLTPACAPIQLAIGK